MRIAILSFIIIWLILVVTFNCPAIAAITGSCSTCHTMHNSQDGTSMNFDNSSVPNPLLLRADCLGCHAIGLATNIDPTTGAPQVYHTAAIDLAGGNFSYMLSGNNDEKGHNVVDFGNPDDKLYGPPGPINQFYHDQIVLDENLTCAGENGCHGTNRGLGLGSGITALKGAHHGNVDGKCDTADTLANSYRFLCGVKGLENTISKWQNIDPTDHNEYYGTVNPPKLGCDATSCHNGPPCITSSPNNSISSFCGTCHGNFHGLGGGTSGSGVSDGIGIGSNASSPFRRHPTDIVLPVSGEYSAYKAYSIEAPVARAIVPDTASGIVQPGTDVVMCLSCHASHGTDYPDILRWDYSNMIAGDNTKSGGCFTCHTTKNQTP